jgi:hypothetical protein
MYNVLAVMVVVMVVIVVVVVVAVDPDDVVPCVVPVRTVTTR